MKDFFLTSLVPYWILFILGLGSTGFCIWAIFDRDSDWKFSTKVMYCMSGVMLFVAVSLFLIVWCLGGNLLWWLAPEGSGYGAIILRTLILLVFLIVQGIAPFAYKIYMEDYLGCPLTIKSQFISLVVVVPAALIIFMLVGQLFMEEQTRNLWFYIVSGGGILLAAIYSFFSNSKAGGIGIGILYTVTSFVLCLGTLVTLLMFIVALFTAFSAMAPLVAAIGGAWFLFGSSFSKLMSKNSAPIRQTYRADDGSVYYTSSERDARNAQIQSKKEGN